MQAIDLANYIVRYCYYNEKPINNLRLQWALYLIQRKFLANGKMAFCDEFEAWMCGPVIRNVYYKFCGSAAMPIRIIPNFSYIEVFDSELVCQVADDVQDLEIWELAELVMPQNGAWERAYRGHEDEDERCRSIGRILMYLEEKAAQK